MSRTANPAPDITVERFASHEVISQPNPLRKFIKLGSESSDDPVARAERALQDLSSEFDGWMRTECNRLSAAHAALIQSLDKHTQAELLRVAHDIKGSGATFGYPVAAVIANSLCRVIEHAPVFAKVPPDLITHHVKAIVAIVRERNHEEAGDVSTRLCEKLCSVADEYLIHVNQDRPEHLDAVMANSPSIVPPG